MKKLLLLLVVAISFISCGTLQEDIYYSSNQIDTAYQSIENFQKSYVELDALQFSGNLPVAEVLNLINSINEEINSVVQEPAIKARLFALEGLCYLMINKKSQAEACYKAGQANLKEDQYVQILAINLAKNDKVKLEKIQDLLDIDSTNSLANLEKAKILYTEKNYADSLVAIDLALQYFKKEYYVENYSELKNQIWQSYKNQEGVNVKNQPLTPSRSLELTANNSTLLNFYTAGRKMRTSELTKALEKAGLFNSTQDPLNQNNSSKEYLNHSPLNRRLAARFLWNLYLENTSTKESKTKYSDIFKVQEALPCPIADVSKDDSDIDAILCCVEKGIMDLTDGKNFYPEQEVSEADFVKYLNKIENR